MKLFAPSQTSTVFGKGIIISFYILLGMLLLTHAVVVQEAPARYLFFSLSKDADSLRIRNQVTIRRIRMPEVLLYMYFSNSTPGQFKSSCNNWIPVVLN